MEERAGGWRTLSFQNLNHPTKLGAPSFPQFHRGKGGNHEPRPSVFHTAANLHLNPLRKITVPSCILVKKKAREEGTSSRKTAPAILRPPLPLN
jgi:hypothetical protein